MDCWQVFEDKERGFIMIKEKNVPNFSIDVLTFLLFFKV